jgi:hypothetical protein
MKTTRIFSAIALLVLLSATLSASAIGDSKGTITVNPVIRHEVNVVSDPDKGVCNTWLVEIRDGNGRIVAPAQVYVPGKSKYVFYERGPSTGVRIAVIVLAPFHSHWVCERELFTKPAILTGTFEPGRTYRYDLYPEVRASRD